MAKEAVHETVRKLAPWVKRVREFEDLYFNNKVKTFDTFSSPIYLPPVTCGRDSRHLSRSFLLSSSFFSSLSLPVLSSTHRLQTQL